MSPDEKDRVDWVVPGAGDIALGADQSQITEINRDKGYVLQPTEVNPKTAKPLRVRVDRIIVKDMPAPKKGK
jgi:hypothetical protein